MCLFYQNKVEWYELTIMNWKVSFSSKAQVLAYVCLISDHSLSWFPEKKCKIKEKVLKMPVSIWIRNIFHTPKNLLYHYVGRRKTIQQLRTNPQCAERNLKKIENAFNGTPEGLKGMYQEFRIFLIEILCERPTWQLSRTSPNLAKLAKLPRWWIFWPLI